MSWAALVRCRADDERGKPTDVGTLGENNSSVCKLSSLTNASVPFSTSPTPLRATSHRRPTPITGYKQRDDLSHVLCLCVRKVTRVKQGIMATNIQRPVGNFTGTGVQPITAGGAVSNMESWTNQNSQMSQGRSAKKGSFFFSTVSDEKMFNGVPKCELHSMSFKVCLIYKYIKCT